ncbi:MAG: hypothetical protein JNK95_02770, partial [Candidatus Competibacter sp.]|nr:hypothetical protein [Candidatus Competibacter sp.]
GRNADDAEAQRQYDAVVKRYQGTPQWMKAPNGEPTKLTERQWVQVRTPAFKAWFGDWEAVSHATPRRAASTFDAAKLAARDFVGKPLTNNATGLTAEVSNGNLAKMTSQSAAAKSTNAYDHALAIANLDQLFLHAELDQSHPDKRGEPTIRAIRRYVAPMVTPDGVVAVKLTVKETVSDKQPNPIYSVETLETAKPALDAPQSEIERAPVDRNAPQAGFNAKVVQILNTVNNGASKVVDANGEPLATDVDAFTRNDAADLRYGLSPEHWNALTDAQKFEYAVAALRMLSGNPDLFQYGKSSAKGMAEIAAELSRELQVTPPNARKDNPLRATHALKQSWEVTMPDGATADVILKKNGRELYIDASGLEKGKSFGSLLYQLVGTYAHNNGLIFIGDPNGITAAGKARRLEHLIALALKFGTTDFLLPHPDQNLPWKIDQHGYNLAQMIRRSHDLIYQAVPKLKGIRYDFGQRRFIGASGNEFTEDLFRELAQSAGARAAQAGPTTLKRSVLVDSLVQGAGREGWRDILGAFARQSGPLGLDPQLKRIYYAQALPGREPSPPVADTAEAQRQYDAVVARYTLPDGTKVPGWLKAPNGQPTKLTERQWVQVRTENFKREFGDWEYAAHQRAIDALTSVPVDFKLAETLPLSDARHLALAEAKWRLLTNKEDEISPRSFNASNGDQIWISMAGLKESVSKYAGIQKMRILPALGQLIENSHFVRSAPDEKTEKRRSKNVLGYRYYVAKAKLDGKPYYVKLAVREIEDGGIRRKFYDHELSEVSEAAGESGTAHLAAAGNPPATASLDHIVHHGWQKFNGEVSHAIDANGEPQFEATESAQRFARAYSAELEAALDKIG